MFDIRVVREHKRLTPVHSNLVDISIIVKAWNEEAHIHTCLSSVLTALRNLPGRRCEVILVDSHSTDATVRIARRFPVTILRPKVPDPGRCGLPGQVGYQWSSGAYCYILDGDMEMKPEFLPVAMTVLEANAKLAGVGGRVWEANGNSYQFRGRQRRAAETVEGSVEWLDMGGLYRREAIDEIGFLSNRNLHAYEEQDLGLRLGHRGWKLLRLGIDAAVHYGHRDDSLDLLRRRWRSGYVKGPGEILRAFWGKAGFLRVARRHRHLLMVLALWASGLGALLAIPFSLLPVGSLSCLLGVLVLVQISRRGTADALMGLIVWQVSTAGLVLGFASSQEDPRVPVESDRLSARYSRSQML